MDGDGDGSDHSAPDVGIIHRIALDRDGMDGDLKVV